MDLNLVSGEPSAENGQPVAEEVSANENLKANETPFARIFSSGKQRFLYSFMAKILCAQPKTKEYYVCLLKEILSYKKVTARVSWGEASFYHGRKVLFKIAVKGKSLSLFVAGDPVTLSEGKKYKFKDKSARKKYAKTPAELRIKSDGALRRALAVIAEIALSEGLEKLEAGAPEPTVKDFPSATLGNLLSRGLIKPVRNRVASQTDEQSAATLSGETADLSVEELPDEDEIDADDEENDEQEGEEPEENQPDEAAETLPENESAEEEKPAYNAINEDLAENSATETAKKQGKEEYKKPVFTGEEIEELLAAFKDGNGETVIEEKEVLKAVDERWIAEVESSLYSLDAVIRKPSHFIEETEEILPIELTRKVSPRSIQHLSQHTNLISKMDDDEIIPSKILNVFKEDSVLTYENKFVNTLIKRLYAFVESRYRRAVDEGVDGKTRSFTLTRDFAREDKKGKVSLYMEITEPASRGENQRDYLYASDIFKRLEKVRAVVSAYAGSEFVRNMNGAYIRPPVMRTNAILKNKNLRGCLALWEFLDEYDDAGAGYLVSERHAEPAEEFVNDSLLSLAERYAAFEGDKTELDWTAGERRALNKNELTESETTAEQETDFGDVETDEVLSAVEIALKADEILEKLQAEEKAEETPVEALEKEAEEEEDEWGDDEAEFDYADGLSGVAAGDTSDENSLAARLKRARRPFAVRFMELDETRREYIIEIVKTFIARKKVSARLSLGGISFYNGRVPLAKIAIRGKTPMLFLALSTEEEKLAKYFARDFSAVKKYEKTPFGVRVKSSRGLKYALELSAETLGDIPYKKVVETPDELLGKIKLAFENFKQNASEFLGGGFAPFNKNQEEKSAYNAINAQNDDKQEDNNAQEAEQKTDEIGITLEGKTEEQPQEEKVIAEEAAATFIEEEKEEEAASEQELKAKEEQREKAREEEFAEEKAEREHSDLYLRAAEKLKALKEQAEKDGARTGGYDYDKTRADVKQIKDAERKRADEEKLAAESENDVFKGDRGDALKARPDGNVFSVYSEKKAEYEEEYVDEEVAGDALRVAPVTLEELEAKGKHRGGFFAKRRGISAKVKKSRNKSGKWQKNNINKRG